MTRFALRVFLGICAVLVHGPAFAQAPNWLVGEWNATVNVGSGPDSRYDLKVLFSANRFTHIVRGGPADHAKGIVCALGFSTEYTVQQQGPTAFVTLRPWNATSDREFYKPSQDRMDEYLRLGILPPPQLKVSQSADGALLLNDRVRFVRKVNEPAKVWDSSELNAFIDYYRGLMQIY